MSVPRREETFGALLREYRRAAGLTQEALAEHSGVSSRAIQEIESGGVQPRRSTLLSLIEALGLSGRDRDALLHLTSPRPRGQRQPLGASPEWRGGPDVVALPAAPPEQAVREPALVALPQSPLTNVPWPISSLLGRESELATIRALIEKDRQRLVTLTGVGGSGKTRLAVQVALDLLAAFDGGVWFVDLAPISDPALVPRVIAGTLGVREIQGAPLLDTLLGHLRRKRLLLVLDNCEHLIDTCAELAQHLLTPCPDLFLLATSREALQIAGEQRRPVRPLAVPRDNGAESFEALAASSSVQLFVERAGAIDADFVLTGQIASGVAQICARLDGIPLAIELAASRIAVLSVEQIAERLDGSFSLLARGTRAGPTRQQTMEATLDWSYDLLTPTEQAAFRTLGVFAGGFTLEAADGVLGDGMSAQPIFPPRNGWVIGDTGAGDASPSPITQPLRGGNIGGADILSPSTLDVLGSLVDKSLVVTERVTQGRRYRLLEPVRQYAVKALAASGEDQPARARHAAYFAALAERAAPMLHGPEQVQWLDRLEDARDNFRSALAWISEHGDVDDGLRLVVALEPYWEARGYLSESERWLDDAIIASRARPSSRVMQMQALLAAGRLARWQVDIDRAETLLTEALTLARELGDRRREAEILGWLSSVNREQEAFEQSLIMGEESLRLGHEVADEGIIALALFHLGIVLRHTHQTARALTTLDECVVRFRRLGDVRYAAIASTMLGWATVEAGEHRRGTRILRDSALELQSIGHQGFIVYALRGLAHAAYNQRDIPQALRLVGASEGLRTSLGMRNSRSARARDRAFFDLLRRDVSASTYDELYAAGEAMSLDQALAEVGAT